MGCSLCDDRCRSFSEHQRITYVTHLPGQACNGAFNIGKVRVNAHWFMMLGRAHENLETRRRDDNEVRPHRAIGYNLPNDKHFPESASSPPSACSRKPFTSGGPKLGPRTISVVDRQTSRDFEEVRDGDQP